MSLVQRVTDLATRMASEIKTIKAPNWVTTTRIADGQVTFSKLADNAVGGAKLYSSAVSESNIADQQVTWRKTTRFTDTLVLNPDALVGPLDGTCVEHTNATRRTSPGATPPFPYAYSQQARINYGNLNFEVKAGEQFLVSAWIYKSAASSISPNVGIRFGSIGSSSQWLYLTGQPALTVGQWAYWQGVVVAPLVGTQTQFGQWVSLVNTFSTYAPGDDLEWAKFYFTGCRIRRIAGTENIVDGAVGLAKLATDAVSTIKVQALAITSEKLADLAVSTAKIANGAVTNAKIADGAINNGKIGPNAVGSVQLAPNAIDRHAIKNTSWGGPVYSKIIAGNGSVATDGSGLAYYQHNLNLDSGVGSPLAQWVLITPRNNGSAKTFTVVEKNSNNFRVRVSQFDGQALPNTGALSFDYVIFSEGGPQVEFT